MHRLASRTLVYVVIAVIAFTAGSGRLAEAAAGGLTALEARMTAVEVSLVSLGGQLAGEATARAQAIANALTAAKAYADQQVGNEAAARASADSALQSGINNEAAARQAADTTLQANIDAEAAARQAADTTLQNGLNNEAAARQAADTTLQGNINAEVAARQNGDAATLAAAKAYTDTKATAKGALVTRIVRGDAVGFNVAEFKSASVECAADELATGGGFTTDGVTILHSPYFFETGGRTWAVRGQGGVFGGTVRAVAICTKIQ